MWHRSVLSLTLSYGFISIDLLTTLSSSALLKKDMIFTVRVTIYSKSLRLLVLKIIELKNRVLQSPGSSEIKSEQSVTNTNKFSNGILS